MARKKKSDIVDYSNPQPEIPQALIPQIDMASLFTQSYLRFGEYNLCYRTMPNLYDGFKISYKRTYFIASTYKKGELISNNDLIGSISKVHPHSVDSLISVVACFVHSGLFEGKGAFGGSTLISNDPPAAARYSKSRISDLYLRLIGDLIKEVPYIPSPNGMDEPAYIPTPLPFSLILKERVLGLGVGIQTSIPNFSPKSLLAAYFENNPMLLEPRTNINIDKNKSELQQLWESGQGKIHYFYNVQKGTSPDGREAILIEGDAEIFQPNLKKLRKLESEGKLTIDDMTDINGPKLMVSKIPGARGITIDDIEAEVKRCCQASIKFQINVTDGRSAFKIPIREWIGITYNNYLNLITQVNQKRIGQVEFEIAVQEALPIVVDYVMNKNPKAENKELSKNLGIPEEIIESVMSKPISHLRKTKDTTERVKALKKRLTELKKFDPVKHTFEIVQEM